jgi:hypothetical protein
MMNLTALYRIRRYLPSRLICRWWNTRNNNNRGTGKEKARAKAKVINEMKPFTFHAMKLFLPLPVYDRWWGVINQRINAGIAKSLSQGKFNKDYRTISGLERQLQEGHTYDFDR